ncbi:unnamed protein product [Peronospora destructor]|uniref:SUI1 domain-containing protein n=1 Tax=Peronospora destructor TaxID=86335 RepID=A0AAV0V7S7_9STRA|nr:unnamed protein product [Peronospora destructor]
MSPHHERLTRFYQKYNAEKLHEIDSVLERFKGRETQLFSTLVKKYGPEPTADERFAIAATAEETETDADDVLESKELQGFNHERLLAFYQKYNPEKVDDVAQVLVKYKGKESTLFDALTKKYGPEPRDLDDEEDVHQEEEASDDDGQLQATERAEHCPDLILTKYNRTVMELLEVEQQIAAGVEGITLEGAGKTVKKKKKNKIEEATKRKENCMVTISKSSRKGRKRLTFVTGLEDFEDVNIKDACKSMGKKFACSSSLSKTDQGQQQIQLQGDCVTELLEVLPEMFGVHEDQIVVVDEPVKAAKKSKK